MKLNGPGKYDAEVRAVLESTGAALAIVILIGGDRGTGFSVAAVNEDIIRAIPDVLDDVSKGIRQEILEGDEHAKG
jgi:hypothetical protein